MPDFVQKFVSAKYRENKITEFYHFVLILTISRLGLLAVIICNRVLVFGLCLNFVSTQYPIFLYSFILTFSRLRLLPVIFGLFIF